ncbi:MAG: type II 3-dehydroquinate dehydratase [Chloroflexi bacterium]|nr:type II 3-dehydroquinate dehydratase [Chloroflexota bacterium]
MRLLVLHGPNLNTLGIREPAIYGHKTLDDIDVAMATRAKELGCELTAFQSNHEGALVDHIQQHAARIHGIIINPGALTHYGLSLRDALASVKVPIIEVHISNIHAREPWRAKSVIAPIATGQITGLGWRGYLVALDAMVEALGHQT